MKNLFWVMPCLFLSCQPSSKLSKTAILPEQFMVVLGHTQENIL